MASVNKAILGESLLRMLYVDELKSIPMVAKEIAVPQSTVRYWLKEFGLLRERADAVRLAAKQGRIGRKGVKRVFSSEWKENISAAKRRLAAVRSKGVSIKPDGYIEYTRGEHKGRSVHVVIMEQAIGRRIQNGEVIHHIDHNRGNNALSNLVLMTRKEHASLHASENYLSRERKSNGQFK